jgi:hypothetical protein
MLIPDAYIHVWKYYSLTEPLVFVASLRIVRTEKQNLPFRMKKVSKTMKLTYFSNGVSK